MSCLPSSPSSIAFPSTKIGLLARARGQRRGFEPGAAARHSHLARAHTHFRSKYLFSPIFPGVACSQSDFFAQSEFLLSLNPICAQIQHLEGILRVPERPSGVSQQIQIDCSQENILD